MSDRPEPNLREAVAARVLLVDDHTMFRHGLRSLLEAGGVDVVGEAHSARIGIELAGSLSPDVVLMDLNMPGTGGIQATRELLAAHPARRVLVLTASDAEEDLLEALLAGACGYLLKDAEISEILAAVRAARSGDASLSPLVATRLVERVRRQVARELHEVDDPGLTPREREVLRRLGRGEGNAEIASALFLSASTVKAHVSAILDKLEVENRVQAAVWASRRGLV